MASAPSDGPVSAVWCVHATDRDLGDSGGAAWGERGASGPGRARGERQRSLAPHPARSGQRPTGRQRGRASRRRRHRSCGLGRFEECSVGPPARREKRHRRSGPRWPKAPPRMQHCLRQTQGQKEPVCLVVCHCFAGKQPAKSLLEANRHETWWPSVVCLRTRRWAVLGSVPVTPLA